MNKVLMMALVLASVVSVNVDAGVVGKSAKVGKKGVTTAAKVGKEVVVNSPAGRVAEAIID
jgi:hypothetical protein